MGEIPSGASSYSDTMANPKKDPVVPLPADATDVIYYCRACQGKATYGKAYFDTIGEPERCPNCGTPFEVVDQQERVHRLKTDTDEDVVRKRDALRKARADKQGKREGKQRPTDPRAVRQQRMHELKAELEALEAAEAAGETPATPGATPRAILPDADELKRRGIKLGP